MLLRIGLLTLVVGLVVVCALDLTQATTLEVPPSFVNEKTRKSSSPPFFSPDDAARLKTKILQQLSHQVLPLSQHAGDGNVGAQAEPTPAARANLDRALRGFFKQAHNTPEQWVNSTTPMEWFCPRTTGGIDKKCCAAFTGTFFICDFHSINVSGEVNFTALLTYWPDSFVMFDFSDNRLTNEQQPIATPFPPQARILSFAYNRLSGPWPSKYLNNGLLQLDAHFNQFTGGIDAGDFPESLNVLHLHNNNLNGTLNLAKIPDALTSFACANNSLYGTPEFPDDLFSRRSDWDLKQEYVRLSGNLLSGPVPTHLIRPKEAKEVLTMEYNLFLGNMFCSTPPPSSSPAGDASLSSAPTTWNVIFELPPCVAPRPTASSANVDDLSSLQSCWYTLGSTMMAASYLTSLNGGIKPFDPFIMSAEVNLVMDDFGNGLWVGHDLAGRVLIGRFDSLSFFRALPPRDATERVRIEQDSSGANEWNQLLVVANALYLHAMWRDNLPPGSNLPIPTVHALRTSMLEPDGIVFHATLEMAMRTHEIYIPIYFSGSFACPVAALHDQSFWSCTNGILMTSFASCVGLALRGSIPPQEVTFVANNGRLVKKEWIVNYSAYQIFFSRHLPKPPPDVLGATTAPRLGKLLVSAGTVLVVTSLGYAISIISTGNMNDNGAFQFFTVSFTRNQTSPYNLSWSLAPGFSSTFRNEYLFAGLHRFTAMPLQDNALVPPGTSISDVHQIERAPPPSSAHIHQQGYDDQPQRKNSAAAEEEVLSWRTPPKRVATLQPIIMATPATATATATATSSPHSSQFFPAGILKALSRTTSSPPQPVAVGWSLPLRSLFPVLVRYNDSRQQEARDVIYRCVPKLQNWFLGRELLFSPLDDVAAAGMYSRVIGCLMVHGYDARYAWELMSLKYTHYELLPRTGATIADRCLLDRLNATVINDMMTVRFEQIASTSAADTSKLDYALVLETPTSALADDSVTVFATECRKFYESLRPNQLNATTRPFVILGQWSQVGAVEERQQHQQQQQWGVLDFNISVHVTSCLPHIEFDQSPVPPLVMLLGSFSTMILSFLWLIYTFTFPSHVRWRFTRVYLAVFSIFGFSHSELHRELLLRDAASTSKSVTAEKKEIDGGETIRQGHHTLQELLDREVAQWQPVHLTPEQLEEHIDELVPWTRTLQQPAIADLERPGLSYGAVSDNNSLLLRDDSPFSDKKGEHEPRSERNSSAPRVSNNNKRRRSSSSQNHRRLLPADDDDDDDDDDRSSASHHASDYNDDGEGGIPLRQSQRARSQRGVAASTTSASSSAAAAAVQKGTRDDFNHMRDVVRQSVLLHRITDSSRSQEEGRRYVVNAEDPALRTKLMALQSALQRAGRDDTVSQEQQQQQQRQSALESRQASVVLVVAAGDKTGDAKSTEEDADRTSPNSENQLQSSSNLVASSTSSQAANNNNNNNAAAAVVERELSCVIAACRFAPVVRTKELVVQTFVPSTLVIALTTIVYVLGLVTGIDDVVRNLTVAGAEEESSASSGWIRFLAVGFRATHAGSANLIAMNVLSAWYYYHQRSADKNGLGMGSEHFVVDEAPNILLQQVQRVFARTLLPVLRSSGVALSLMLSVPILIQLVSGVIIYLWFSLCVAVLIAAELKIGAAEAIGAGVARILCFGEFLSAALPRAVRQVVFQFEVVLFVTLFADYGTLWLSGAAHGRNYIGVIDYEWQSRSFDCWVEQLSASPFGVLRSIADLL